MQISPISQSLFKLNNNLKFPSNKKKADNNHSTIQSLPMMPKNYYLTFRGGYSLELKDTMHNFDSYESENDKKIVPDRVREIADFVLEANNPRKLTLIDIHKKAFEEIKTADSLEEVKVLFPEFEDVLSIEDLNVRADSFIGDVKSGKCEIFDASEDLSLQLLKLYWADGFSLSDLEKYTNGKKNIAYVMQRLNIPRFDSHYGHILKLSDKEYNERLMHEIALKRAENYEARYGHVDIPRGSLSTEHRRKISESLMEYYVNNPERVYLMSAKQKEFYENNPEAAEMFRLVVKEAWKLGSSKPVRNALKNFFELKRVSAGAIDANSYRDEKSIDISNPVDMSTKYRNLMQEFWDTNPHAKEKFSLSMKYAWKRMKELEEVERTKIATPIPAYPLTIRSSITKWADEQGYDSSCINFNLTSFVGNVRAIQSSKGAQIITEYFENNEVMADVYADSICYSLAVLRDYLLSPSNKSNVGDKVISKIESGVKGKKHIAARELVALYIDVVKTLVSNDKMNELAALIRIFETSYNAVINFRTRSGMQVP